MDAAQFKAEAERVCMACLAERLADEAGSSSQYARVFVADKHLLAITTGPSGPTETRGGREGGLHDKTEADLL